MTAKEETPHDDDDDDEGRERRRIRDVVPSKILDRVYLGDRFAAQNVSMLEQLGITHVLSCISGGFQMRQTNIIHKRVPMSDFSASNLQEHVFPICFEFLKRALRTTQNIVLIHCSAGINRSATVAVGFVMDYCHVSLKEAHRIVKTRHPTTSIHDAYMTQLIRYDKHLHGVHSAHTGELPTTSSEVRKALAVGIRQAEPSQSRKTRTRTTTKFRKRTYVVRG